jgi:3-dehydroquinate dehydratase type I
MIPKVCVSILPKTVEETRRLVREAEESGADFVEVRLDNLAGTEVFSSIAKEGNMPKIAADRNISIAKKIRTQRLLHAAKSGFNFVDFDVDTPNLKRIVESARRYGAACIVSYHDTNGTPIIEELERILQRELESKAAVCKLVTSARTLEDNLLLLDFVRRNSQKTKLVCFAMGEHGKISRLLSPVFGAFFTFASLRHGSETAPGQITIAEMRQAYSVIGLSCR